MADLDESLEEPFVGDLGLYDGKRPNLSLSTRSQSSVFGLFGERTDSILAHCISFKLILVLKESSLIEFS